MNVTITRCSVRLSVWRMAAFLTLACLLIHTGWSCSAEVIALFNGGEVTLEETGLLQELYPLRYQIRANNRADKAEVVVYLAQEVALDKILAGEFIHAGESLSSTMEQTLHGWKRHLLASIYLDTALRQESEISEEELHQFYHSHPESYRHPTRYWVRNIFKDTRHLDSLDQRMKIQVELEQLLNRLKAGEDFEALAKQYSDSPEDQRGRLQGPIRQGEMNPAIEKILAGLKPGDLSGIVELPHGYQILRLERMQEGQQLDFQQVKETIRSRLMQERQAEIRAALIRRLETEFAPAFPADEPGTLYQIGDYRFTRKDWERAQRHRQEGTADLSGEEQREALLAEYYERDLLAEKASREGLEESRDFLKRMELVRNHIIRGVHFMKYLEKQTPVSQSEVIEYLHLHREQFLVPESYHLREIVLQAQTPEDASPRMRQESLEEMKRLAEEILRKSQQGESFAQLAQDYSASPSRKDGGDLGWISNPDLSRVQLEGIQGLHPSQISPPILDRARMRYTLILLEDRKPKSPMPEEAALLKARQKLFQEKQTHLYDEHRQNLLTRYQFRMIKNSEPGKEDD